MPSILIQFILSSIPCIILGESSRVLFSNRQHPFYSNFSGNNFKMAMKDIDVMKRAINLTALVPSPLKIECPIMFWRLQKVGSTSVESLILSYAFRYNLIPRYSNEARPHNFCFKIMICSEMNKSQSLNLYSRLSDADKTVLSLMDSHPIFTSTTHQLCPMDQNILTANIKCAFKNNYAQTSLSEVREIFMLREPISRAISAYYFYGELFKMKNYRQHQLNKQNDRRTLEFGRVHNETVFSSFIYHGNEGTPPSNEIAESFALRFPYMNAGLGPSWSYSAFARNSEEAIQEIKGNRMITLILERLDESLVVMAHLLKWSLADVVYVMPRKNQSNHPKMNAWPTAGITSIKNKLIEAGEMDVYGVANAKLDNRIAKLVAQGVDVASDVSKLKYLREKTAKLCFSDEQLSHYIAFLGNKSYLQKAKRDKYREVSAQFNTNHAVRFNGNVLYSFEVCAGCEAHSLVTYNISLEELDYETRKRDISFINCPS